MDLAPKLEVSAGGGSGYEWIDVAAATGERPLRLANPEVWPRLRQRQGAT